MKPKITLIGTFRKRPAELKEIHHYLSNNYQLLSPVDVNWLDPSESFVKAGHEVNDDTYTIEQRVLDAIEKSDAVWLFAPDGYVGLSAAFEIGYAHSKGVPVYTDNHLDDVMLGVMVENIGSIKHLKLAAD